MKFSIPEPLILEHEELHKELSAAIESGGETGRAANAVAELLHPHFVKEEEYALPPLGLLQSVAREQFEPEMVEVLSLTDRLKADLPEMVSEHQAVVAALEDLRAAAAAENKPEFGRFAEKLVLHARTEEMVFYPAAILVGEYVRTKSGERSLAAA
jgi:hypothetical protein